ncbi:MarR family winged helix-turn-helix transcriptional regulator [Chloroflexota bacterium]
MENKTIDDILDSLFQILPIIHKKLLKIELGGVTGSISHAHLAIMRMLGEGSLPISEVARRLVVPKSQMTHLVDQLVDQDIVVRQPDTSDRRVINISLTSYGWNKLEECRELVKQNIRNKISSLSPSELMDLSEALAQLRNIGTKLE